MAYTLGKIDKKYVSAIDPMFDTREINKSVTDIANEDNLTDILWFADRKKVTTQPVYYTFVNEPVVKKVQVGSVSAGTSGTTQITITLTSATSGIIAPGDILMFSDTTSGQVYSVTTASGVDTIVVNAINSTVLTAVANDYLSAYTQASGENSINPQRFRTGNPKYSNKVQTFRVSSYITDIQSVSAIEVKFGNGDAGIIMKDHIEKKIKLKSNINAAFIGGDMSSTSYSDASPALIDPNVDSSSSTGGGAVQTTRGLDKYVAGYGVSTKANSGTPNGTVSKADIDAHLDALTANRAGRSYFVGGAKAVLRAYDTFWKNLGSAGVTSARLMVDGKELDFEVQKVTYGGYELNYGWLPIMDNPSLFTSVSIGKSAYYVPFDKKVKVQGGGFDPAMQIRYMPQSKKYSNNDLIGEIHYGANSPVNPSGRDAGIGMDYVTTQGLEVLGAQFFGKQQVLA